MARVSLFLTYVLWAIVGRAVSQTGLSEDDKRVILDAHNYFRDNVDPPANNMETMVWNDVLAEVAQNHADKCVNDHNEQRTAEQSIFRYVGENLFARSPPATNPNYTAYVEVWNNEKKDYDYKTGQCSAMCGHYTQVVWATSSNLGCGAKSCAMLEGFAANSLFFVCNYGPGGNTGTKPYETNVTYPDFGLQLQPTASIVLFHALIAAIVCIVAI